ncbi:hypothetical protein E4U22_003217 [Claviceps purpurea]|nr:hypothetical protein E4U28_005771 [Claviceps purpurea]KAG6195789.1 hypothetical protein E4U35_008259 [Claviceps purpurea]KAG6199523.1 hypothetical protein E4U10_004670 [Claviceps purpurea]KAG6237763.1 hypothetical protein E4U24_007387 [Claviceps purpurea]KAG6252161.1 hypothetical protein E4U49_007802 [Claviceps purpurea]
MSSKQENSLQNLPSVQDGAQFVTLSEMVDRLTAKMDALIKTVAKDSDTMQKEVAVLNAKLRTLEQNSMARSQNVLVSDTTTFAPLMNIDTGHEVRGPACLNDVRAMDAAALSSCLEELGINPEPTDAKKQEQLLCAYGVKFHRI